MERLQKVMASRGVASRRECEELILAGRVTVNGAIVREMGTKVSEEDVIGVDGRELPNQKEPLVYLMLNKPKGYVTTVKDPQGRNTVMDLLPNIKARVFPVGRLDYDTEGLLILTNDGELTHALTHPSHGVNKTYQARIKGIPTAEELEHLRKGVVLEDGLTAPADIRVLKQEKAGLWIDITIHEGRNRQVLRMLEHIGHPVIYLARVKVGSLHLEGLPTGKYRLLKPREVRELKQISGVLEK
jgi:23S rRNA pseudouridine2605 synthase/16S rRNA pseudouridine516 synthase